MRVLNVEDDPFKHYEIKEALRRLGITDVTLSEYEFDAIVCVTESIETGNPYDLIISDMQFPLLNNGPKDNNAGMKFIADLKENNIDIPVIVCSSDRLRLTDVFACVHYQKDKTDLWEEFRQLLPKLPKKD